LVNTPFDSVIAGVANCDYEVAIAAISVTEERTASMLFTDPYVNAGQIVVIEEGNTAITGVQDLTGLTVAAQLGTTGEIEAQRIEGVVYRPYDTYDLAFLDLNNGQVDAVIADYLTALGFIAMNPGLVTVGEVFTDESYAIAVCHSQTALRDQLNVALNELIADGTVAQLEQEWLTAPTE
jgi:polar amino acid transport system substrate-binding protein